MKFSPMKIFIFSIFTTIIIFSLVKSPKKNEISNPIFRLLSTKTTSEMRTEMCDKSSSDLTNFYRETKPDYTFEPSGKSDFLNELLMNFANNKKDFEIETDQVKDYAMDNAIYIFCFVLFILSIILWIPYMICVCTKKCCCVPESCSDNLKYFLISSIVVSGAAMICCFIGYSQNTNILHGIYGLGCSILKMEYHLVEGDEYRKDPLYWLGLGPIVEKLSNTTKEIQKIGDDSVNICQSFNKTKTLFDQLNNNINAEWNAKKGTTFRNPLPNESGNPISPNYLSSYGSDGDDSKTCLGSIKFELSSFEKYILPELNRIVDVIDIKGKTEEIKGKLDDVSKELNNTVTKMEDAISDGIGDHYDKFDEVDSIVRKIMNILFSLNLTLVITFAVSALLLIGWECGKFLMCISWFFVYIFMILSFILGIVFGLVSSFIKDGSSAVKYVMSNTNQINYDKIDILDSCINGNGSLSNTQIIPTNFNISIIDNIYNLERSIDEVINAMDQYNCKACENNKQIYYNISKEPKTFLPKLKEALEEIELYINSSKENTKIEGDKNDRWEVTKNDCGDEYLPLKSLRNLLQEDGPHCLVITEWDWDNIRERYTGLITKDPHINLEETIHNYFNSTQTCAAENQEFIDGIIEQNDKFNNSFNKIKQSEIDILHKITETISPLKDLFKQYIGEGSIFEIMNCKFVKRDVNKVLEVLYDEFGGTFKTTSNLFLTISVSEVVLTIFVLIIMKSFKVKSTELPDYSRNTEAK